MYEFILPDLGEGVREGEVLKWHVAIGEAVGEDEPLVDVETDKAAVTIPSPKAGTLVSRAGEEGDTVKVGKVLCSLDVGDGGGAAAPAAAAAATTAAASTATQAVAAGGGDNGRAAMATTRTEVTSQSAHPFSEQGQQHQRALAAPATRRLAREKGIDINAVPGTGPAGRVTPDDVLAYVAGGGATADSVTQQIQRTAQAQDALAAEELPAVEGGQVPFLNVEPLPDYSRFGEVEKEPLRSIRRKIAYRMTTSAIMAPHVYHMDEADVTELEDVRRKMRTELEAEGNTSAKLTLLAFTVKAIVKGLREVPAFNASIDAVRQEIVYKKFFNIGIAVAAPQGLVVPVLRDCDKKSVAEIAEGIVELATKARNNELAAEDFQGGCFTVTNMGALGGTNAIPMVNYPEVAILAMAKMQEKPVARDGLVTVRKMLPLTLSFDHRIGDGSHAATFMNGLVRRLSDPQRLLVEM